MFKKAIESYPGKIDLLCGSCDADERIDDKEFCLRMFSITSKLNEVCTDYFAYFLLYKLPVVQTTPCDAQNDLWLRSGDICDHHGSLGSLQRRFCQGKTECV